jgi:hypothetical protein
MPRTSNDRLSLNPESDTSPESKSEPSLMRLDYLTFDYTPSWLTPLPLAIQDCLASGGTVAISTAGGSTCVTLESPLPTKDAP